MKVQRPEWLLMTLFAGVLGAFTRAYWPTEPRNADLAQLVFWIPGLLCLMVAFMARGPRRRPRRGIWLAYKGGQLLVALFVLLCMSWMHASSYITAFVVSPVAAVTVFALEVCVLAVCAWLWWRRPTRRPVAVAVGGTALFVGSIPYVLLCMWMWNPPTPGVCEAALRPAHIDRLSPSHWPADLSQPYSLEYIPEESLLMATFKMAGNGQLSFWNDPSANRVLGVDVRDPAKVGVMPLTGVRLPLYHGYDPATRQMLVSRIGPALHSLDLLALSDFPRMTHARGADVDYAPREIVTHPSERAFGVFGHNGEFSKVHADTLAPIASMKLARAGTPIPATTFCAWHAPETSKIYVSSLMSPVAEVDMDTMQVRWGEAEFGGGYLTGDASSSELYVTDHFLNRVDVISYPALTPTRSLDLDYTPRPVQVDRARDLLMVGDWFGGEVHLYRLSTLTSLGPPVPVGPYLRDFSYDHARGLLFTASKCGVYQVKVEALVASAAAGQGAP